MTTENTSPVVLMDIDEIKVNDTFRDQLPPLSTEEYRILKEDIKRDKAVREAIVLWEGKGIIVDGHNRYQIATELKFKQVPVREKHFQDEVEVRIWIAKNQSGRRNLTGFQRAMAALECIDEVATLAKKNQKESGGAVSKKSDKPVHTDKILADMAGMSHTTLRQVLFIKENATDEQIEMLRKGEVSINRIHTELKEQEKEAAKESGGTQQDYEDGQDAPEQPETATKTKKGQTLEKQIDTHLKRLDSLLLDHQDTRHKIIDKVSKWLKEKRADL